jgi:hypothetical protein
MALSELIYVSTVVGESEHELGAILESSVRHNQLNGITGMLLYYRGGFMQVLEGYVSTGDGKCATPGLSAQF